MGVSVVIAVPPFPNVPALPGVPQLIRSLISPVAQPPNAATLVAPAMPSALFVPVAAVPVWGVFNADGTAAITPDSIMSFGYRAEWRIADYPIQDGQFSSYNKVKVPYENLVRMVKGSSLDDRTDFENDCDDVAESLDLYTIVTPERSYIGVNVTRFEIERRETGGANFIEAEMFFREIRQTTPQYSSTAAANDTSNAQNPGARPVTNTGLVQPQVNTAPAVQKLVTDYLNGNAPPYQSTYFPNTLSEVTSTNFARIPDPDVPNG